MQRVLKASEPVKVEVSVELKLLLKHKCQILVASAGYNLPDVG